MRKLSNPDGLFPMAYKRKRSSSSSWGAKRRRTSRYKRFGNRGYRRVGSSRRAGKSLSAQAGDVKTIGFRGKRMRKSSYRRALLRHTLFSTHYRTIGGGSGTNTADANPTLATHYRFDAISDSFWTAAGGTQIVDTGVALPNFTGNLFVRGGVSKITLSNNASVDSIRIRLWLVFSTKSPDNGILPANPSTQIQEWDPSLIADFERYGRVILAREFFLVPGQRPTEFFYKWRPRKVDPFIFNADGARPFWFLTANQVGNTDIVAQNFTVQTSYNVSFSGDGT